jgi:hypothetical protein
VHRTIDAWRRSDNMCAATNRFARRVGNNQAAIFN